MYFIIYSILGYICEVIYCSILLKKLTNRGFLYGPYCPIYGFGGILVLFLIAPFKNNFPILLINSFIIPTSIEYFTSWILEKSFNMKWWDYSNKKFNINGRICLLNSVLFALLSIFLVYIAEPFITGIVSSFNIASKNFLSTGIIIIFSLDLLATLNKLVNLEERMQHIIFLINSIKEMQYDFVDLNFDELYKQVVYLKEEAVNKNDKAMLKAVYSLESFVVKTYDTYKLLSNYPKISIKFSKTAFENFKQHISDTNSSVTLSIKKVTNSVSNKASKLSDSVSSTASKLSDSVDKASKNISKFTNEIDYLLKEKDSGKLINFYNYFWVFMAGSFLGYIFETFFILLTTGTFINRQNLIFAPLNIVYGIGSIIILLIFRFLHII